MFLVMSGLRSDNEGANLVKISKQVRACEWSVAPRPLAQQTIHKP
jgi:hypothetical protein